MSSLASKIDLKMGKRYVYFSTLAQNDDLNVQMKVNKLADKLRTQVTKRTTSLQSKNKQSQMDQALDFLSNAAAIERTKELDFFQNFSQQFPEAKELFDLDFKDMDKDYITFIANINKTLKGAQNFEHQLKTEIDRIKRYQKASKFKEGKKIIAGMEKQYHNAATGHGRKEDAGAVYFKRDSTQAFESIIKSGTIASEITKYVLSNFGGVIMRAAGGGRYELTSANFASLIKILNDKAYTMLIDYYGKVGTIKGNKLSNQLNNEVFTKEYEQFVNSLLESPSLPTSLTSISKQFGINDETMSQVIVQNKQIENLTHNLELATRSLRGEESFDTWFEKNKGKLDLNSIVQAIGSISVIGYYTGEDLGVSELVSRHIGAILGGRTNPTDDILAGILTVKTNLSINEKKLVEEYQTQMTELQAKYFDELKKTTTVDSVRYNTEKLQAMQEEQLRLLEELKSKLGKGKKGLDHLLQHINIHDTIKGYSSAGSNSFKQYKGFEGASFGSNLDEQLGILQLAQMPGGIITKEDKEFFEFALVNAGSQMIGGKLKRNLEDYFSVFLGFFMFNDAYQMVQQAKEQTENNILNNNVNDLHIYQLNGVYVPSSYLLQKTYDELTSAINQTKSMAQSGQGTRAVLHTYSGGPQNTWEDTWETAKNSTKLEMRFLGGFFDLLDNISKSMKNLG